MTPARTGDLVPIQIDLGDVPYVLAALRNRRDYHSGRARLSVPESNIQQHHIDGYESLDRVCRDLNRAAEAAARV